jgi:hypothetical protein
MRANKMMLAAIILFVAGAVMLALSLQEAVCR